MDYLLQYQKLGYSFFNTKCPTKKVVTKWTDYQKRKPTEAEIKTWRILPYQNYAIVCGEISNLIVFDVDTKNGGDPTPFQNRGFYEVRTPSGGYHFYTKYNPLLKSTKHKKENHEGILKGVDVQSNGAIVFAPPTSFPQGGYTVVNESPLVDIPEDLLLDVLDALAPEKEEITYTPQKRTISEGTGRPGDIFNALATWDDVLIPLGWTKVGSPRPNGMQFWKRPGKKDHGVSASTNWNGYDLFFPYTTSVDNLLQKRGYTKFRLYATLNFNGDFKEAAKSLVMENYKLANGLI